MNKFTIHPDTRLGTVHLTISDLARSLDFYSKVLGLPPVAEPAGEAHLGVPGEDPLLHLRELKGARPKPAFSTGLYHFAILLPSRKELARVLRHLLDSGYPLQGAADHLVSEALYLADPDGNGIEIYSDRPRDAWPRQDGGIQMATDPLDVDGLMAEIQGDEDRWSGMTPETRIGHIHLQVSELRPAEAFYREVLGFELMARFGAGAAFLSAGGYHHHLGLNVWGVAGAPPPPDDSVGLRHFSICLPGKPELEHLVQRIETHGLALQESEDGPVVSDPSQNRAALKV